MRKILFVSIVGVFLASVAWASDEVVPNLNKGTKSLDINGFYDANSALDYQFNLGAGFGYFFIDNFQVSAVTGWQSNVYFR